MKKKKIAIIGTGNLGRSIALGLLKEGVTNAKDIILTKRHLASLSDLIALGFQATSNNVEAVKSADIILLCVQPNQLDDILEAIKGYLTEDKLIISVITGIPIAQIVAKIDTSVPVVRAMPNTAISIGESMTCISSSSARGLEITKNVFDALGKTLIIEEELMQAATILGASGIAFFMRYIRAASQGGVQLGFDSAEAQLIAMQTAKGAASLVLKNHSHPEVEIDKVTTPQGCTIEGLNEMEHKGFSSALIQGIVTSYNRITTMKKTNEST